MDSLLQNIAQYGIAGICVGYLIYDRITSSKAMNEILLKMTESLAKVTETLNSINMRLSIIEEKIEKKEEK